MAIVNLRPPVVYGYYVPGVAGKLDAYAQQMNASGEAVAYIFTVPKSGDITGAVFQCSAVGSAQDIAVTLETVGTDGRPTGTGYKSSTSATWSPSTGTKTVTFGTQATSAVAGDIVCLRFVWASTAGDVTLSNFSGNAATRPNFPTLLHNSNGSTFTALTGVLGVTLIYGADYHVPFGCLPPASAISYDTIDSASNPKEVGIWFNLPFAAEIAGIHCMVREFGTTALLTANLYSTPSGTPTQLASFTCSHDTAGQNLIEYNSTWTFAPQSVSANTDYVLAIGNRNTTDDLRVNYADVASASYLGNNWALSYASRDGSSSAFTKTTTRNIVGGLVITGIDTGGSSGPAGPKTRSPFIY